MEKLVLKALVPALFFLSTACGPVQEDPENGTPDFQVVQGALQKDENGGLTGTALVRFDRRLETPEDPVSSRIIFSLNAPGSFVSIRTHGDSPLVSNGITVTFARGANDRLTGSIQVGARTSTITAPRLAELPIFSLGMNVTIENAGIIRVSAKLFDDTVVFDSARPGDVNQVLADDPREGTAIGLRLNNAYVKKFGF